MHRNGKYFDFGATKPKNGMNILLKRDSPNTGVYFGLIKMEGKSLRK